jgi:hypothetical protein
MIGAFIGGSIFGGLLTLFAVALGMAAKGERK